jgi:hypothetical protein
MERRPSQGQVLNAPKLKPNSNSSVRLPTRRGPAATAAAVPAPCRLVEPSTLASSSVRLLPLPADGLLPSPPPALPSRRPCRRVTSPAPAPLQRVDNGCKAGLRCRDLPTRHPMDVKRACRNSPLAAAGRVAATRATFTPNWSLSF